MEQNCRLENRLRSALVIDDDGHSRSEMAMLLSAAGFTTSMARTISDAQHLVAAWLPQLVIINLHLPHAFGPKILRAIRGDGARTRVMIVSGDCNQNIFAQAQAHDGDVSPDKSINLGQLFRWIGKVKPRLS